MKTSLKILIIWFSIFSLFLVGMMFFPHKETSTAGHFNTFVQILLFLISIFIIRKEPNPKNKFIFINFLIYFAVAFFSLLWDFMGIAIFPGYKYASHIYFQYTSIAYVLTLSFAIVYLVMDLLFRDFRVYQKYLATVVIVFTFFGYLFYPFFQEPLYLYSTEDIQQWRTLDAAADSYRNAHHEIPGPQVLGNNVTLQAWKNGVPVADLYPDANLKRIEELVPYLEYENWRVLLLKPLFLNMIYMNVLLVGFILLFFGYQYKKDPPQGAYIDKIMFLVLLSSSMDILHNWGYIKSVEWGSMTELFAVGQYITIFAEVMMVLFFSLRLRFITSVQGEFYELELAEHPKEISRWRDWVDNLVLSHFFNLKIFNGRLFQNPSGK